jgi:hypothetical protein
VQEKHDSHYRCKNTTGEHSGHHYVSQKDHAKDDLDRSEYGGGFGDSLQSAGCFSFLDLSVVIVGEPQDNQAEEHVRINTVGPEHWDLGFEDDHDLQEH